MEDYKKKYEEIIEKIKEAKERMGGYTFSSVVDKIIPELKESEDERVRKFLIETVNNWKITFPLDLSKLDVISWLEKQGEQKSAWSEEDERHMNTIVSVVRGGTHLAYENELDWLKLLKERCAWKPSDEQMEALSNALGLAKSCGEESSYDLRTLYEQLKKLREE